MLVSAPASRQRAAQACAALIPTASVSAKMVKLPMPGSTGKCSISLRAIIKLGVIPLYELISAALPHAVWPEANGLTLLYAGGVIALLVLPTLLSAISLNTGACRRASWTSWQF